MLLKVKKSWEMPESQATPESVYFNRRQILKSMGMGGLAASSLSLLGSRQAFATTRDLYPAKRNEKYTLDRDMTPEKYATSYVNFYEFGSSKDVAPLAQAMPTDPWTVTIDGLVDNPMQIGFEDLVRKMTLEERLYRFRCVEAWAMAVPWSGFPLSEIVKLAQPKSDAKYIMMETLTDKDSMPGLAQFWYPWPYQEGVTIDEAMNELSFIATGFYGKEIPKQNGAPLRLVLPWKYGFKSIKSIVKFSFVKERPISFWEKIQDKEYGFWANVNPDVPHPRWSQSSERLLGAGERVPTQLFNGYEDEVAYLYKGMSGDSLFR